MGYGLQLSMDSFCIWYKSSPAWGGVMHNSIQIQFKNLYWHIHYINREEQETWVQWHGLNRISSHNYDLILSSQCSTWLIICQKDEKPIEVYEPWIRDNKNSLFRKQVQVWWVHNKLDNSLGTISCQHNIWYIAYMNNVNTITCIGTLN